MLGDEYLGLGRRGSPSRAGGTLRNRDRALSTEKPEPDCSVRFNAAAASACDGEHHDQSRPEVVPSSWQHPGPITPASDTESRRAVTETA